MTNEFGKKSNINGSYIKETDFGIAIDRNYVWTGEFPFKAGDTFPTKDMRDRADISKTNRYLYDNNISDVYNSIVAIWPEIDPLKGMQIKEIIGRLPYFKNCVDNWVGLICGKTPFIESNDDSQILIDNSNLVETLREEAKRIFLDGTSAYRLVGSKFESINTKNILVYMNPDNLSEVLVTVIFNIYKNEKGSSECEFICYFENGHIIKRVFNYNGDKLGREITDKYEEGEAFKDIKVSPVVVCRHNIVSNQEPYGKDMFRYWDSSICGAIREFQNLLRAAEKCTEIIRKIPAGATTKDNITGVTVFMNRGNIEYDEHSEKFPDIEYVQPSPEIISKMIDTLDRVTKQISVDSGLGDIFFNIEKSAANLSAAALKVMMFPTLTKATAIKNDLEGFIKRAVKALCAASGNANIDSNIYVTWRSMLEDDDKEQKIVTRLQNGLITKLDAVAESYDIPKSAAKRKLIEILTPEKSFETSSNKVITDEHKEVAESTDSESNINSEIGEKDGNIEAYGPNEGDNINDNNLTWETQKLIV